MPLSCPSVCPLTVPHWPLKDEGREAAHCCHGEACVGGAAAISDPGSGAGVLAGRGPPGTSAFPPGTWPHLQLGLEFLGVGEGRQLAGGPPPAGRLDWFVCKGGWWGGGWGHLGFEGPPSYPLALRSWRMAISTHLKGGKMEAATPAQRDSEPVLRLSAGSSCPGSEANSGDLDEFSCCLPLLPQGMGLAHT